MKILIQLITGAVLAYLSYPKTLSNKSSERLSELIPQPLKSCDTSRNNNVIDNNICYQEVYHQIKKGDLDKPKVKSSYFNQGYTNIPNFLKRKKGGEDAFVSRNDLLVVADGVGGWDDLGVDPGLFSKSLVKDIEKQYQKNPKIKLKDMLIKSVKQNNNTGSATVVIAAFDQIKKDQLRTCALGDSGYIIFRIRRIIILINYPYQCGTYCPLPYNATENQHQLQNQDIIVMGSDGLFDNLYEEDFLPCLYQELQNNGTLKNAHASSKCIAKKAESNSHDVKFMSPFAKQAQENGIEIMGGKLDDITVIVAQVIFEY